MVWKILIVGGAGLIGAATALHLAELGHEVTIAGRTPPRSRVLEQLPFLRGSFLGDDFPDALLGRFDSLVFAAGNDVRQLPVGADEAEYFHRANSLGVPAFFARARRAGISTAVYVGSYYSYVLPAERIDASGYLRSRRASDEGVRALANRDFRVCSLNAPFIIGYVEGVPALPLETSVRYLLGLMDGPGPRWMIPGGGNFMSTLSFAEAVSGALERGENGKGYLVGDENWTFAHYYELLLDAMGVPGRVQVRDEEHPSMPDFSLYAGRGATVSYEPDTVTVARLGYRRHDAERVVREMAPYYRRLVAESSGR
jgi:nucleoside-diphosphate-sugar epimerase